MYRVVVDRVARQAVGLSAIWREADADNYIHVEEYLHGGGRNQLMCLGVSVLHFCIPRYIS